MIIDEDYKLHFYDRIRKDHVLVITNVDADAVCATQILLDLFGADDVAYTVVPVDGWEAFGLALREHTEQVHSVVLFNCGGTKSLVHFLRQDMTVYVIDSRRPLDLDNVYYDDGIRLILNRDERKQLNIPNIHEIELSDSSFSEDGENEGEEEGEDDGIGREVTEKIMEPNEGSAKFRMSRFSERRAEGEGNNVEEASQSTDLEQAGNSGVTHKRVRDVAEAVEIREVKRRRRMERQRHRDDILWRYYENSWHAPSSAVVMLEVAHSVGRTTVEMMWSAAVGISSQLVEYMISPTCYAAVCFDRLRPFKLKFMSEGSDVVRGDDILRLKFNKELTLPFYSHWSLYSSMVNNDYFFCRTRMWQQSGLFMLKSMLVNLEITLDEAHQVFRALTSERKKAIFDRIRDEMDENFATFTAHIGFSKRYNSCDFGRAIAGRLSYGVVEIESPYDRFLSGQEILRKFMEGGGDMTPLSKSIESYKNYLVNIVNLVFMAINQSLIVSAGSFYLLCFPQEDEVRILHSRHFLSIFTNYALRAFNSASRSRNRVNRPLFVAVPLSGENVGWYLITGIMPLNTDYEDDNQKSFVGRAMEKVIQNYLRGGARQDSFDPALVMIHSNQKARFFDGLQATLELN